MDYSNKLNFFKRAPIFNSNYACCWLKSLMKNKMQKFKINQNTEDKIKGPSTNKTNK